MRLVYKFKIKGNNTNDLFELCKISKNLYNQALYIFKNEWKTNNKFLSYYGLDKLMKTTPNLDGDVNYKLLKAQVAQQCLKTLINNVTTYVRSIKDWKKDKEKYNGLPKLPSYKRKYNQLIYTNQSCTIKDGLLKLSKELAIKIPQWDKYKNDLIHFQQVRINPIMEGAIEIEIIYLKDIVNVNLDRDKYVSIDLGIDNLATCIFDKEETILYNGKQVKALNQFFNKSLSFYKSELEKKNKKKSSKRIQQLYNKRNNRLNDIFHKLSKNIVKKAINYGIGTIVVGYNKGWKDSIHLGKRNNQTFVMIPYEKLLSYLQYKCTLCGISFIINEESYTSKCDSLAREKVEKHDAYLGKRVKRGLYQSSTNKLLNADVNGSLNILRKVVSDSNEAIQRIIDSGRLFLPIKCNIL